MLFTFKNPFSYSVSIVGDITDWEETPLDEPLTVNLIPEDDLDYGCYEYKFRYVNKKTGKYIIDNSVPTTYLNNGEICNNIILDFIGSDFDSDWLNKAFKTGFKYINGAYYYLKNDIKNAKIAYASNIQEFNCIESAYRLGNIYKYQGNTDIAIKLFKKAADGGHSEADRELKQLNKKANTNNKSDAINFLKSLGDNSV